MGAKPCCCAKENNIPTFSFKDCLKDITCVSNCCDKKEIIIEDKHKNHHHHHHHHHKHKHHNQSNNQSN
jgi:hypothetical protein